MRWRATGGVVCDSRSLRRRLQAAESRLKLPQLSPGEVVTLQKQVVDLRGQLDQLSQLSPKALES